MLAFTLRVPSAEVEEVLDAVLPALPGGLHVRHADETTELTVDSTPGTPGEADLRRLAGPWLLELIAEEVSDDWRERRLGRYEPTIVAARFLIRPDWAPAAEDPDLIEVVLGQSSAFGTGLHPTTQACLAVLADMEPGGSLADYGCGSAVLSIAAQRLGWSPIVAVDVSEPTVAAARRNAARNGVDIDIRELDLTTDAPPMAETIVANVPPEIHTALTLGLERAPSVAIVSGFHEDEIASVAAAWRAHGLEVSDEVRANEWMVLVLR